MEKLSNTNVAAGAKEPSHDIGVVAVVHMEVSPSSRFGGAADRAQSVLVDEHIFIGPKREAVSGFYRVILGSAGVRISPFFLEVSRLATVIFRPRFVVEVGASLATLVEPIVGFSRVMKFHYGLCLFTPTTVFHALWRSAARRVALVFGLFCYSAWLAITVQAVILRTVFVKMFERLCEAAGFTGLFHGTVSGFGDLETVLFHSECKGVSE